MLNEKNQQPVILLLLSLFLFELIRTAWIGDDAAITLRTALNFLNGFGPTFNIDERVQAYTHPLWFFLLSATALVVRNVFAATFLVSIGASVLALWMLLARVATNSAGGLVAAMALLLSKAYLDYATSGLENPLSHLLMLAAVLMAVRSLAAGRFADLLLFFLSCALIYLNRPDLLLLVFPLATLVAINAVRRNPAMLVRAILLSALPVIGWTLFSIFYYGFPVPNTAYAKLGTGIPFGERVLQGGRYLMHTVSHDPLTAWFIVAGLVIGLLGSALSISLAIGMVIYLGYVLSIGGDFMGGRFLTAPLLAAAIIVSRCKFERAGMQALGAGVLVAGLTNIHATLLSDSGYTNIVIDASGISDERGYFYQRYAMLTGPKDRFSAPAWVVGPRRTEVICGGLGFSGIYSGPGTHYIDDCALADPLLARLPAKYDPNWRIGHFTRDLPPGYRKSILRNQNLVVDPVMWSYYNAIRSITRDRLSDIGRLRQIVSFNLGKVSAPDWERYRHPSPPDPHSVIAVDAVELSQPNEGGTWNAPGNVLFHNAVEVALDFPITLASIDLSVDSNDTYRVDALGMNGWRELGMIAPIIKPGMARHVLPVAGGMDNVRRLRVTALGGDGMYSLGHLVATSSIPVK